METILTLLGIVAGSLVVIFLLSIILLAYLQMVDKDAQRKAMEENPFKGK